MNKTNFVSTFFKKSANVAIIAVMLVVAMLMAGYTPGSAAGYPYTVIGTVVEDISVTITGYNFPPDQTFTVRMNTYGTLGVGGTVVGTKDPSSSSTFTATYAIPASLAGASKIAIRFDSPNGYYAYDWFTNNADAPAATATAGPTPTAGAAVPTPVSYWIPTFSITAVQQGLSVTVLTNNFPANQTFTVRMGEYGTLGIGGTVVDTFDSGTGGSLTMTFSIPAVYAARDIIAIRMDSNLGYYSYNWFVNSNYGAVSPTATPTATSAATEEATATPEAEATSESEETETPEATEESSAEMTATPTPTSAATVTSTPTVITAVNWPYFGIPTFMISSVVRDQSVTISAVNFPPNQTFTVSMGPYGSMGIGGIPITTYESGAGGSFTATYSIPAALAGSWQIAIRLESTAGYYYAYNWFYNN